MKFDFKNRGFVVITLSAMLIAVGVINYQLSKQSALTVSKKFEAYEIDKTCETLFEESENKVSGEYVYAYPPGSPIIVPGEIINSDFIYTIKEFYKNGVNILSDSNLLPLKILTKK